MSFGTVPNALVVVAVVIAVLARRLSWSELGNSDTDVWRGPLVLTGAVLGSVLAWFATTALSSVLVGVTPSDPASYAIAIALIAVTAVAAAAVPARHAASVDPLIALRTN